MSEALLTQQLCERLCRDFDIQREVPGSHPIYKKAVRIDLMLRAKPHLVAQGFTEDWFGVECKWTDTVHGATSLVTRMVWQSITYAQSSFSVDGKEVIPSFVAVCTPEDLHPSIESHLKRLLELGLYGNVGRLYFYRDVSWGIKFASIYASAQRGGFHVNKAQLPKRRAGSV